MKKRYVFLLPLLSFLCFFTFGGFKKDGGIKEIVKPYLGVYACEKARLDEKDFLRYFKKITIELKADETFFLTACPKLGRKMSAGGGYFYDQDADCFKLRAESKRTLPEGSMRTDKGKLYIQVRYGNKLLFAVFSR